MNLQLYYAPTTCALVPHVTLMEAGADFSVIPINLRKGQQRTPDYLRLNPKHKVPVLMIDGEPLSENVAIQLWIAHRFPAARLLPSTPGDEIKALSLMVWFASGIHPSLSPNFFPERFCDLPGSEESVRRLARNSLMESFAIADERLKEREWFFEHFTAVDAYFFWCFRRGTQAGLDLSKFTHCAAHRARVEQRPSVQSAVEFEAGVLDEFSRTV